MKTVISKILPPFDYSNILHWGKMLFITGGSQIIVQLIGFISGILIIRLLSTQEYAFFTLANTMLGTMVMLADSGIANGVMAESGKVWQDKDKLGSVIATGLSLRRRFGLISLIIILPVLSYLLIQHGAGWLIMVCISIAIIPAFFASVSDSILEIVPKLHQDIKPLQKNQIEVGIGRLLANCILLFALPYTALAVIASGLSRIYGNIKLKTISDKYINSKSKPNPVVRKNILKGVNRTLPIVIYHCISGQISIWLVSIFGTTESISQIGALGRLSTVFSLFISVFSTIIIPRFARMTNSRKKLLNNFLAIQLITLFTSIVLLVFIWFFSEQILWILGNKYHELKRELFLIGAINCAGLLEAVCSQLVLSRGWFLKPYFLITLNFSSTIISFTIFKVHSLEDILIFTLILTFLAFLLSFIYGIISIQKISSLD